MARHTNLQARDTGSPVGEAVVHENTAARRHRAKAPNWRRAQDSAQRRRPVTASFATIQKGAVPSYRTSDRFLGRPTVAGGMILTLTRRVDCRSDRLPAIIASYWAARHCPTNSLSSALFRSDTTQNTISSWAQRR
jgi:hypothetical protein